jgi:hypothetical protein
MSFLAAISAPCGACGFIGKVADFEPKDSYTPENEAAQAEIARGMARGD